LWSHYARTDDWGLCEDYVMRVDVDGNLGYVVSEGIYPSSIVKDDDGNPLPADEVQHIRWRYRSTEVYKRDDGEGRPEWRMWHFHCSTRPPDDEVPPTKTERDTTAARGLGNTPHHAGTRTDYEESQ
jgi:hypothetical protein